MRDDVLATVRSAPAGHAGRGLVIDPGAIEDPTPPDGTSSVAGVAPRRRRRLWLRVALGVVALGLVYYCVNVIQVRRVGDSDQAQAVDAIVVMGAAQYDGRPSPQLQARLDHVVELWERGLAPLVVVTGGNQPGDHFTEAGASALYLTDHGVDPGAILAEDRGHSSWESLHSVAEILRSRGARTVLLVSDPYHSLRIRLMAQELGFTAYVSPTRTSPVRGGTALGKDLKEAAGISVGRIIGFGRLLSITG